MAASVVVALMAVMAVAAGKHSACS
jgi:hypothetical protein